MAILRKYFVILAAALLLTGCYTNFEPDIKSTPVLCMNSLLTPGEPLTVSLTRTWRWSEGSPDYDLDILVRDAEITYTVNGSESGTLTFDDKKYRADYIPAPGDHVVLSAHSDRYGDATAEVTVPVAVAIDRVETDVLDITESISVNNDTLWEIKANFKVWFTDPADQENFYLFGYDFYNPKSIIVPENPDDPWSNRYYCFGLASCSDLDYEQEPIFGEHIGVIETLFGDSYGYSMFSDRTISGKSYPLRISAPRLSYKLFDPTDNPELRTSSINMILYSISKGYYRHLLGMWELNEGMAGSIGGSGLGDAVWDVSNVSTGAGVVAARTAAVYPVQVYPLVISNR